jgi:hypothetical protein
LCPSLSLAELIKEPRRRRRERKKKQKNLVMCGKGGRKKEREKDTENLILVTTVGGFSPSFGVVAQLTV